MASDRLTILAVDDEHTQLEDLARMLRSYPSVEEVECAFNSHEALLKASSQQYDAIFLDVRMPDLDGVELGRVLRRFAAPPQLVFVSAYDSAAVDAFELHAVDYLRKPVSRRRVEEALHRVLEAVDATETDRPRIETTAAPAPPADSEMIAVASSASGSHHLISRNKIIYVQSYGDFMRVVTEDGHWLLRARLQELERRWEQFGFVRVHRQYLANLVKAVELRPQLGGTAKLVFANGQAIPIARRHVTELGRRLGV